MFLFVCLFVCFMVGSETPYICCYFSFEPKSFVGMPLVTVALQTVQGKDSWQAVSKLDTHFH